MTVIDASVWVSYYNSSDVNHLVSRNWVEQQLDTRTALVGPTLVLAEVGGAIARRLGQVQAYQVLDSLRNIPDLVLFSLDEPLMLIAVNLAIDLRLRGADASYVVVAQQLNLPLITWDREIISRTAGVIQAQTP